MKKTKYNGIVPVEPKSKGPEAVEEVYREIRYWHDNFGFTDFMFTTLSKGWRNIGFPPLSEYEEYAKMGAEVKKKLKGTGIRLGWWIMLTIKSGLLAGGTPIILENGKPSLFANCPLDPAFQDAFSKSVTKTVEIAHPDFIILEDDYSVYAASNLKGCFCPRHLAGLSSKTGRKFDRESLISALAESGETAKKLRKDKLDFDRDTMVGFSKLIREAVDKVDKTIEIGLCEPGDAVNEGDMTLAVCRALAAEGQKPWARIYGALYLDTPSDEIPSKLYHPLWQKERFGDDFRYYHESDTYPQTRFFSSSSQLKAMVTSVASYGYEGSVYQVDQWLDSFGEEPGYAEKYRDNAILWGELSKTVRGCQTYGVSLPSVFEQGGSEIPAFFEMLNLFGIPYTTRRDVPVAFWDEDVCRVSTEEQIEYALSHTLFLDPLGVKELASRGYGEAIGVEIGDVATDAKRSLDLGEAEVIRAPYAESNYGKTMWPVHCWAKSNGTLYQMKPMSDKTEILTEAISYANLNLGPVMTRFKNRLGGEVIVFGMTVAGNDSQSFFNYRRKRLITKLLDQTPLEIVYPINSAKLNVIQNLAKTFPNSDLLGTITLTNYSEDTVENPVLHLPSRFLGAKAEMLLPTGDWTPIKSNSETEGQKFICNLPFLSSLIIRFIKD